MKEQTIVRKIENQANKFKLRAHRSPEDRKRHDQTRQDEQKWMWTAKQLGWSFPKIGSVFGRDRRTAKQAVQSYEKKLAENARAQQQAPTEARSEQKPCEETPHRQKMRELAKALAEGIHLPSPWDEDLWRDFDVEFRPGKYSLSIGTVEIGEYKQIKVNYYDVSTNFAEPHLVKGLLSHLSTSGLSRFAELVGGKGKLNNLVGETGQYSQALLNFLKLMTDEVKGYRAKVDFHDEGKPGLTKWFIVSAWNDAIQKAGGYSWIDNSWYKPCESVPGTNLWQLRGGGALIGIARSKRTLKSYEAWHKKLILKYVTDPLARDIAAKDQELGVIAQDIKRRLQEFCDMQQVPGHCELG